MVELELARLPTRGPATPVTTRTRRSREPHYVAIQSMLDEANPPGMRDYFKAGFLDELDDRVVERLVTRAAAFPSPQTTLILQPLGGAVARMAEDATPLGNRSARWAYQALSLWADAEADEANIAWTRGVAGDLASFARPAGFPNFIAETGSAGVAEAYGTARGRLEQVKRMYDPDNTFRLNHNIVPAGT